MANNAGVWIDHQQAIVVLLDGVGQNVLEVLRDEGAAASGTPAGLEQFHDRVIAHLRNAQAIVISGAADATTPLRSRIVQQNFRGPISEMATGEKQTTPQIAANVRKHFQAAVAAKAPRGIPYM